MFCWLRFGHKIGNGSVLFTKREPILEPNLTNRMWFSIVCTLIDNDMRHHSGQKCGLTRSSRANPQQILSTVMTHIVVDKSTDKAKPQSICFLSQYQSQIKCFF